jgi:hypothetical protein
MGYIAPTVNSILQQFIAAKWTITINISGFQINIALLLCEIVFTWIVMGISFIVGVFALPDTIMSAFTKRKMSRPVRIVLTIVFPLLWIWNRFLETIPDRGLTGSLLSGRTDGGQHEFLKEKGQPPFGNSLHSGRHAAPFQSVHKSVDAGRSFSNGMAHRTMGEERLSCLQQNQRGSFAK